MSKGQTGPRTLVLASGSPRRLELLRQIGIAPDLVDPPHIDETPRRAEAPLAYARRMARDKLAAIAPNHPGAWVLAADTVVACGRRILPKAETEAQARQCLELLSGRRHRVLGGIAIAAPGGRVADRVVATSVAVKRLLPAEIAGYIASGDWHGKAGGYAIQSHAAAFIPWINGSYSNVVGLSLSDVNAMLGGLGWHD
jgi:septum formation protein